jgi:hypothetical protein
MRLSLSGPDQNNLSQRADTSGFAAPRSRLVLGIERFGLVPLRAPRIAAAIMLVLTVVAVFGLARIRVDDSLSQLF